MGHLVWHGNSTSGWAGTDAMGSVPVSPDTNQKKEATLPTYEYECPGEGVVVELSLPFDHERPICRCGAPLERVYSAPAVKFNGTGFYSTGG
jgi:predicted nucleic acid-binding Zn ribbon protein